MTTGSRAILLETSTSNFAESQAEKLNRPFEQGLSHSDAWRLTKGLDLFTVGLRSPELFIGPGVSNKLTPLIGLYGLRELAPGWLRSRDGYALPFNNSRTLRVKQLSLGRRS